MRATLPWLTVTVLITTLFSFSCTATAPTTSSEPQSTTEELLTTEELADGWISLFDGKTLYGWQPNKKANWKVVDGAITADSGKTSLLCTTSQWGNYELKLDFRTVDGGNSGVFLRTPPKIDVQVDRQAYEVNISGPNTKTAKPTVVSSTDWQTMEVTANGFVIRVQINGKPFADYHNPTLFGRGFIGLQYRTGKIQFRNIKLRPLAKKSLFNDKDLTGWNTYPDMKSVFTVTEQGELNVKNGRGQLETKEAFDDFTLQMEVFVAGKHLNSGIFFRCIPGEIMNGYESQIHNGFLDGDRSKPTDCGTGGIFRRQNARRVVADDFTWFFKTIHADDNHIAVWVNGNQVSDWVDHRKPNQNPRRGLRLEPGTIMIQGHDPTTNISFRNLHISELPER